MNHHCPLQHNNCHPWPASRCSYCPLDKPTVTPSANNSVTTAVIPNVTNIDWRLCEAISDAPAVDEALRGFSEDPTADNAAGIIREVIAEYVRRSQA